MGCCQPLLPGLEDRNGKMHPDCVYCPVSEPWREDGKTIKRIKISCTSCFFISRLPRVLVPVPLPVRLCHPRGSAVMLVFPVTGVLKPDPLLARPRESEKGVSLQAEMPLLHFHPNVMAALSSGWLCSTAKLQLCLLPASWKPPRCRGSSRDGSGTCRESS